MTACASAYVNASTAPFVAEQSISRLLPLSPLTDAVFTIAAPSVRCGSAAFVTWKKL